MTLRRAGGLLAGALLVGSAAPAVRAADGGDDATTPATQGPANQDADAAARLRESGDPDDAGTGSAGFDATRAAPAAAPAAASARGDADAAGRAADAAVQSTLSEDSRSDVDASPSLR